MNFIYELYIQHQRDTLRRLHSKSGISLFLCTYLQQTETEKTILAPASTWEGGTGERESHRSEENCTREQKKTVIFCWAPGSLTQFDRTSNISQHTNVSFFSKIRRKTHAYLSSKRIFWAWSAFCRSFLAFCPIWANYTVRIVWIAVIPSWTRSAVKSWPFFCSHDANVENFSFKRSG